MALFREMRSGESLDEFHQRCVVPTTSETIRRNQDVDNLVRFLQHFSSSPYTVDQVLKSGSLGKGTAVRDCADIDLVVVFNGLKTMECLIDERPKLLEKLQQAVSQKWPSLKCRVMTPFSLCYSLDGQEVDILPVLNIFREIGSKEAVYEKMKQYPKGKIRAALDYSASLARLQIDFVKQRPEEVKKVIRLLKLWKKENDLDIRSYSLELLTIDAASTLSPISTLTLFRKVLTMLGDCGSISVMFDENYAIQDYKRFQSAPYIVDPASPYMNTLNGVTTHDVSRAAREMLLLV